MNSDAVYTELTPIFRDILDNENLTLTPQTTAADVPAWDSLNHINIVAATEAAFKIKFKTAEIEELKNVGEFVSLIQKKLASK